MKFDIIAGIHYPHRLACAKSAEEVADWLKVKNYVRLGESRIGLAITEVTVIPRATYERRADIHS